MAEKKQVKQEVKKEQPKKVTIVNRLIRPLDLLRKDSTKGNVHVMPKSRVEIDAEDVSEHMVEAEKAGKIRIIK